MNEARAESSRPRDPDAPFDLKKRLEDLTRGECSADDFVRESLASRGRSTDSWELLSFIDQRYRLGQLPDELFQSIKSRIAWSELQDKEFGTTVELTPVPRKSPPPAAAKSETRLPVSSTRATATAPVIALAAARQVPAASTPETAPKAALSAMLTAAPAIAPSAASPAIAVSPPAALAVEDIQQIIAPESEALPRHSPNDPRQAVVEGGAADGATRIASPTPLPAGSVLAGRYVLEGILGSGGMGTVYKALDRRGVLPAQAERRVALKVLREQVGQSCAVQVQLRREFVCTQGLSHPNIVKVFELDGDGDIAFYTMELLSGEPLSALIAHARPAALPRPYAWAVIRAVGGAIAHAHARNVIHGDLKPQNVMITAENEVRVLDFGSSRTSHERAPQEADPVQRLTATPPYASCDVLEGEQPDPRDDLYSLACLCHELLSGHHPFHGKSSVEAREAGLSPVRPQGLTHEQWRALRAGLSWSRAERSIPVVEWLERLGLQIEPQRLPDLKTNATARRAALPQFPASDFALPALAAVAALLIALASGQGARHSPVSGATTIPAVAAARPQPAPAPTGPSASSDAKPASASSANVAATTAAVPPVMMPPPAQATLRPAASKAAPTEAANPPAAAATLKRAADAKPTAAPPGSPEPSRPRAAAPTLAFTARSISLRRGASFAEVRVTRSGEVGDFAWWTEDGSAVAGSDYLAQPRITRNFSSGLRTASLYVRVSANPERRRARTFYVHIAPLGKGVRVAGTRVAIIVPASR